MTNLPVHINKDTGLLSMAEFLSSPNYDLRPTPNEINLLVIHNISLPPGEFHGDEIEHFFLNKLDVNAHPYFKQLTNLKVSAHLLIRRNGNVKQFVPFHYRAWHAGDSIFDGRTGCNDFSIGIEVEGTDQIPYTNIQYQQLSMITEYLLKSYPEISMDRIVGHQTIAPMRKTDPGPAFDWNYYKELVKKRLYK